MGTTTADELHRTASGARRPSARPGDLPTSLAAPGGRAALWRLLRRWAAPVLGVVVLGLLLSHAHRVDWSGAWEALKAYPPSLLGAAFGLALASHALYGCYDLIGRHHTGHPLTRLRTWAIAVTSYAFNLNLGSLVGGVALRARLYARAGLDETTVGQVVGLSLATNWLGYGLLAGSLFAAGVIRPPVEAHIGASTMQWLGMAMIALVAGYVAVCAMTHGRRWTLRGRSVCLPAPGLAVVQMLVSACNWALMGSLMYLLLGRQVPFGTAMGVLMAASVVGVFMPIPGGLGVLEAVFLALLSGHLREGTIMGAVLAYRALYYLLPLAGGLVLYGLLERYAAAHPAPGEDAAG